MSELYFFVVFNEKCCDWSSAHICNNCANGQKTSTRRIIPKSKANMFEQPEEKVLVDQPLISIFSAVPKKALPL